MTQRPTPGPTRDWEAYHAMVAQALEDAACVAEIGCGDGAVAPFPWRVYPHIRLFGIDPDPAAVRHPHAASVQAPSAAGRWPLEDDSMDLLLARYVLEHVERPSLFFQEAKRVLRPGGRFLFLTPNSLHPAALASRCLPVGVKRGILRRTRGVDDDDVFPTWYRLNTTASLGRNLVEAGFAEIRMQTREFEPCPYITFCSPGAWAAKAYFKIVRRTGLETRLGASILGEARLPAR